MTHRITLTTQEDVVCVQCCGCCTCSRRRSDTQERRCFPNERIPTRVFVRPRRSNTLDFVDRALENLVSLSCLVVCVATRFTGLIIFFLLWAVLEQALVYPDIAVTEECDQDWEEELRQWGKAWDRVNEDGTDKANEVYLLEDLTDKAPFPADTPNPALSWLFW